MGIFKKNGEKKTACNRAATEHGHGSTVLGSDIVRHNVVGRKFGPCSEVYSSLFKLINRRFQ
jgi:argininosuccinate synthase